MHLLSVGRVTNRFEANLQIHPRLDFISNTSKYFLLQKKNISRYRRLVLKSFLKLSNRWSTNLRQFRKFSELSKFVSYPDTTLADKLESVSFEWPNLQDLEVTL